MRKKTENPIDHEAAARFEQVFLPHLDAAYNLARWLVRNDTDAEDVVQESFLRALRFFGGYRGGDSRSWLLAIVRNSCYSWLQKNRSKELPATSDNKEDTTDPRAFDPEELLVRESDTALVREALEQLPLASREILVLREMEEMSYKEISEILAIPLGTVMSGLARARKKLHYALTNLVKRES